MAILHRSGGLDGEALLAFEVSSSPASVDAFSITMSSNTPLNTNDANLCSDIDTDRDMDSASTHNIDSNNDSDTDDDTDDDTECETHGNTERETGMPDNENGGQRPAAWTMGLYSALEKLVVKAKGAASKPVVKFIKK